MKKQIRYIVSTLFLGGILSTACTGNFEKFNTLDGALTDDKAQMDNNLEHGTILYMRPMMEGIYFNNADIGTNWTWQTMQNLVADMFCGYFHDMNTDFFGNNTCYVMTDGWNKTNWEFTYQSSVPAINKSERDNVKSNPYMAVTKILKVATLHRISDYYGPICYKFNFEDPSGQGSSSQKEVYEQMFKDLDEALTLIDKVDKTSDAYKTGTYDILMRAGNRTLEGWARWANSLRLRLALRVSPALSGLPISMRKACSLKDSTNSAPWLPSTTIPTTLYIWRNWGLRKMPTGWNIKSTFPMPSPTSTNVSLN